MTKDLVDVSYDEVAEAMLTAYQNDQAAIHPVGYRIAILMAPPIGHTDGGVLIPDDIQVREGQASMTGCVVELGPDAYKDKRKFPGKPWCKVGDWVVFRAYSGTKMINVDTGQETRIINDDTVEGVVSDPRKVVRK